MKQFLLYIIAFCFLISCKKDDLPRITQKGSNTFGCKIDGETFVPQKSGLAFPALPPLIATYLEREGSFTLSVSEPRDENKNGRSRYMYLDIKNLRMGINSLNEIGIATVNISEKDQVEQTYTTTPTSVGTLNITRLDTVANIIAGTFSFQAVLRPSGTATKSVTDGRFDVQYKQ